jgi:hypothetical protein
LPIAAYSPGIFVGSSRRGDVLVDAGHVVERVVLEPAPALAVEVVAEVELALEVGLRVRGQRPPIAVHRHLVAVVRGPCARREERRQLDAVGEAVRAGREHVVEPAGVVGAVGLDVGLRRRNNRDEDDRLDGGDETPHVTSCRPRGSLAAQCHAMRHLPARQVRRSVRRCC